MKQHGNDTLIDKNHHNIWKFIRDVTFTTTKGQTTTMDPSLLNEYFASIVHDPSQNECIGSTEADSNTGFQIELPSEREIIHLLQSTNSKASAGQDGLPGHVIKNFASSLGHSISQIFNASITQSTFPVEWKKSNICAIWKNKGSKSEPSNYRPISIIPILGRTLEKVVAKQLSNYCDIQKIIPAEQYGFRKNSSCESALLSATDKWINQIDSGKLVGALLIDLTKAFDSVPHHQLLQELATIQCESNSLEWFQSYLSDRKQRVVQKGTLTPWKPVTRGVPQGSCLSPLLFNIFIRDLPISSTSDTWQFADDITQSEEADNVDSLVCKLTNTFQKTKQFCQAKHLEINASKTQFIIFKNPGKKIPEIVELKIDLDVIRAANQVKLLGVTLDRHLTFKDHIANIVITGTCNGLLGVLRRTSHLLPRNLCKMFYTAIIRANLEYASNLLLPVAKVHLDKLDVIQRKAARIICQVPADCHADPLLEELGLQSLQSRRIQHLLSTVSSCLENKCHLDLVHKFIKESTDHNELTVPTTRTMMGMLRATA